MFSPLPLRHIRSAPPRFPAFKMTVLAGLALVAGLSFMPQSGTSATVAGAGDLGSTVEQLVELRTRAWEQSSAYQGLPQRPARQNQLLNQAVAALSAGSIGTAQVRLEALQADLNSMLMALHQSRQPVATACGLDGIGVVASVGCWLGGDTAANTVDTTELRASISQRYAQIRAERTRLSADLAKTGLDVKPEQLDGLLQLASASDLLSLHSVYTNFKRINVTLQQATEKAGYKPEAVKRYFGVYTVMIEVAMHLHEETYLKLRGTYLPALTRINSQTAEAYRDAKALLATVSDAATRTRLQKNITSLKATLEAGLLYAKTLEGQAQAINASWENLKQQQAVGVNSYRTASLATDLLQQMQDSATDVKALMQTDVPAISAVSKATLSTEFEELSQIIKRPNI